MISRCKSCCGTIRSVAASGIYEISYRTYGKLFAVRELALIAGNGSCSVGIHNAGQSRVAARDDIGARCCDSAGDKIRRTVGIRIREFLPVYDLERIVGCFEVGSSRPSQSADRNIPAGQRIGGIGDLLGKRDVECNRLLALFGRRTGDGPCTEPCLVFRRHRIALTAHESGALCQFRDRIDPAVYDFKTECAGYVLRVGIYRQRFHHFAERQLVHRRDSVHQFVQNLLIRCTCECTRRHDVEIVVLVCNSRRRFYVDRSCLDSRYGEGKLIVGYRFLNPGAAYLVGEHAAAPSHLLDRHSVDNQRLIELESGILRVDEACGNRSVFSHNRKITGVITGRHLARNVVGLAVENEFVGPEIVHLVHIRGIFAEHRVPCGFRQGSQHDGVLGLLAAQNDFVGRVAHDDELAVTSHTRIGRADTGVRLRIDMEVGIVSVEIDRGTVILIVRVETLGGLAGASRFGSYGNRSVLELHVDRNASVLLRRTGIVLHQPAVGSSGQRLFGALLHLADSLTGRFAESVLVVFEARREDKRQNR